MTRAKASRSRMAMPSTLNLLCAGAVQGLIGALQPSFERDHQIAVHATFGAVGAMRDALRGGAPCDVLVVTEAMIDALLASGEVRAGSATPIGRVQTALAVPIGSAAPKVESAQALKAALDRASALYFPDAALSTAGVHAASMIDRLGLREALAPRLRMFANGRTAMRALADDGDSHAIGCTQATEIRATPGITLVGALPAPFALATVYSAAIAAAAASDDVGRRFIALLADARSLGQRVAVGFDEAAL
jgi:molybdate transport system substrate-binding protein